VELAVTTTSPSIAPLDSPVDDADDGGIEGGPPEPDALQVAQEEAMIQELEEFSAPSFSII